MNRTDSGPATDGARLRGNYVMLRADKLRLLLPQGDIGAAEYVDSTPQPSGEAGLFLQGEGESARPVVALSSEMRTLADFPADRFLLTRLGGESAGLSFAWNEVRVLIEPGLAMHALPSAMQTADAPIDAYVELDGELALCTSAAKVLARTVEARG